MTNIEIFTKKKNYKINKNNNKKIDQISKKQKFDKKEKKEIKQICKYCNQEIEKKFQYKEIKIKKWKNSSNFPDLLSAEGGDRSNKQTHTHTNTNKHGKQTG